MLDISLPFAVKDFDDNEILPAGTRLNLAVLASVAAEGARRRYGQASFLGSGNIRADLDLFLNIEPYKSVFGGREAIQSHLDHLGGVPIPIPLLQALDLLKKNDLYTYRHSLVVFALTTFMMTVIEQPSDFNSSMFLIGPTHDLGKLTIPPELLNKTTPLTEAEKEILKLHPVIGYIQLCHFLGDTQHPAALVALNHHERPDGSGYPRGLTDLSPLIEMVAACDVYDALITPRPYRKQDYDNRTALEELTTLAEQNILDRYCIQVLISRNRAGHPPASQINLSSEKRGTPPADNNHTEIAGKLNS